MHTILCVLYMFRPEPCCSYSTHGAFCLLALIVFLISLFLCLLCVPHIFCSLTCGLFSLSVSCLSVPPVLIFKTQRDFPHFCSHQFHAFSPTSSPFSLIYKIAAFPPYFHLHPPPPPLFPLPSPPPLCVIHNGPSAGLHVSHMGGTPVFFNTFLIPPFDAPLVHHNLYWLLNKIKGLVLAASRLCCSPLQKNAFFMSLFSLPPPLHTPWYVYFDMKVGLCESHGCCKSLLISGLISLCCVCVCVCVNELALYYIVENASVFSIQLCVFFFSLFRFRFTRATDFLSLYFPISLILCLSFSLSVSFSVFVP